jgi:nucleoside-diphosphate-sugar epimerase
MKIFVTGGSGFVGKRLIRRLAREQHEVSALARSDSSTSLLEQLGARVIRGTLDDIDEWEAQLEGHDVVIHLAAPPEFWGPWELFYDTITRATINLLAAAARMKVKRCVFVSSEAALLDTQPLLDIDETAPYPWEPNSYRGKAKQLAEREILGFRSDVYCVILRPPYIWGEGNKGIENVIAKIRSGRFRWIDNGQATIETVHAENVVEAIALACTKGTHKQVYFVTDDDPGTVRDHFVPVLKARGIESPTKSVPNMLAQPLATICDFIWKRFELRNPPPLSKYDWYFVAVPRRYRLAKIKRDLGYEPIFTREMGLREIRESTRTNERKEPA